MWGHHAATLIYSIISAVKLLLAGLTFAARAILSLRASDPNI